MNIITRRTFTQWAGAGATAAALPNWLNAAPDADAQKVKLAFIGAGGRAKEHIKEFASQHFVAFCDVDEERASETYKQFPDVPRFKDYRVMFDKMGKDFEAVTIAVPDHMHYPIVMWALAHGKHVYCEKPLCRTFEEAQLLKKAAKDAGVITQMGNQGHSGSGVETIQEWAESGILGDIKEAYHWTNRPIWPQGIGIWPESATVPSTLDWNLWLGVAPKRDFSPNIVPFNWRGYWDYGCGAIGDIACHCMDASWTGLQLGYPTSVTAESSGTNDISFPKESTIVYEFPARKGRGPVKVTWMDGGRRPKDIPFVDNMDIHGDGTETKKGMDNGTFIVGTKASVYASLYSMYPAIRPREYHKELKEGGKLPAETLPRPGKNHFMNFINGIKEGKQPTGNIVDYAADFTATALLGTVALAVPGKLEFDAGKMEFASNPKANSLLKSQYEYRKEFFPG